jgi:hypothetical protein
MADENSSVVSIVGIVAIVILVGVGIYFLLLRGGDEPDLRIEIELPRNSSLHAMPDVARAAPPFPAGVGFPT